MVLFGKSKRMVNISIDDFMIRIVENNGNDLTSLRLASEKQLPKNVIENGRIVDEPAFYQFMKSTVQELGIKNRHVRFFVPQSLVILREVEIPDDVSDDGIKGYINIEIGNTIHFPFKNPYFDIFPKLQGSTTVTILAAPEDDILTYMNLFSDISLKPTIAEIEPLGIYRYFLHRQKSVDETSSYLMVEYNFSSVNISIFQQHHLKFLRHQPLTDSKDFWIYDREKNRFSFTGDELRYQGEVDDQLNEIDRIMNFYRFSIYHGEKEVDEIVVVGDSIYVDEIANLLSHRFNKKVTLLDVTEQIDGQALSRAFIPVLGLALRGGKK